MISACCSGGCAANALHASGDILGTYAFGCDIFRKRIECAVMMKAAQAQASCGEPAGDADAEEV